MNRKEREIEQAKKICEVLDKVNLILDHLGISESEDDTEPEAK